MKASQADQAAAAIDALIKKTKPNTSTTMKSAIVGLFTADAEGQFRYSGCIGMLHLDMDRHLKSTFLRIYDLESIKLVFQVEMYYGFALHYKQRTPTFYTFQYPRGVVGFLFKHKNDAEMFKVKINSQSPSTAEFQEIRKRRIQQQRQKRKDGSFFGKLKKGLFGKQQKHQEHQSVVIQVHKERSITFDMNSGTFNAANIPPQWQQLFDQLNLSPQDLKDKEVVNLIVQETIMQQVKTEAMRSDNVALQRKIKQAEEQQKQYVEQCRVSTLNNLPPPPPPPPLIGPPPQLSQGNRVSTGNKRANLMDEIRNNNLKLKHIDTKEGGINLDLSNMNKQDRLDHAERLRLKLQARQKALNRRKASDNQDSD